MSKDSKVETTVTDKEKQKEMLEALKAKADMLGIKYSPNIGLNKLKEKIDLHLEELEPNSDEPLNITSDGPNNAIHEAEKKSREPILVRITDNDPNEASNTPTIVHTVGNVHFKIGAIIKKDTPQLVPRAIVNALKLKTMIKWVNSIDTITKRPTGNKIPTTKRRFNIEYLSDTR